MRPNHRRPKEQMSSSKIITWCANFARSCSIAIFIFILEGTSIFGQPTPMQQTQPPAVPLEIVMTSLVARKKNRNLYYEISLAHRIRRCGIAFDPSEETLQ